MQIMSSRLVSLVAALVLAHGFATTSSAQAQAIDRTKVEQAISGLFGKTPKEWQEQAAQDDSQAACSQYRDAPPAGIAKQIAEREARNVVLPADDKFVGDWKSGEKIAQSGYGGRHTDDPKREVGGNCYACHQLSRSEVSFGTLGPTLLEYGKIRKYKPEEAKAAFIKIYNSQSVFPCSKMPRLGHNKHLSEKQIQDLVALLFDPESPVNK